MIQRETRQQQQEWLTNRQKAWEKRVALRLAYEERSHERERWYLQQPDRRCRICQLLLPASAFDAFTCANSFKLYTQCKNCHKAWLEDRQLPCCFCQKRTARRDFLSHFKEYALCADGIALSLCCKGCESAFLALPAVQQYSSIRSCCQRTFPPGQVIYAEIDPVTDAIRYVGRTAKPARRHAQHLCDRSATQARWGAQGIAWYTRRNWMQALAEKQLKPSMQILHHIENSPLVLEWEQRFICHGIQQSWQLLNWETMDAQLVSHIKASPFDFLNAPFDALVQQKFFSANGLVAFLHNWHHSPIFSEMLTPHRTLSL